MTVEGRLQNLIHAGSPLITMAETKTKQDANARGLMNSSMAVQAGQAATYQAALPIAQQDAQTAAQFGLANQGATNAARQFSSASQNQAAQFNAGQSNQILTQQLDQAFKTQLATSDAATRVQLQQMQGATQTQLANIQADYQTLMQTSQSAASIYSNSINGIADIVKDTNMDATAKAAAINGLVGRMKSAMNVIGSINGVALSGTNPDGSTYDLLDFGTVA